MPTRVTDAQVRVGSRVGGWLLEESLGTGGSATVYRATHTDQRVGALKLMHAHLAYDREWIRRLRAEAALLRSTSYPGLARLLDVGGEDAAPPYLVMELLTGHSLHAQRQRAGGKLPVDVVLRCAEAVLDTLCHTHALGVIHRDLKPSNVFVTNSGDIKVLDFGIAGGIATGSAEISADHTRGLLGTPAYMSPEQARGRWDLVDERSDLWSLGALTFTLLSGQHVHLGTTENETLGLAMSRPPRSLATVAPGVDRAVVRLVDRALAYEPEERWQSAYEFRKALRETTLSLVQSASSSAEAAAEPTQSEKPDVDQRAKSTSPRRWIGAMGAASTVVVLASIAFAIAPLAGAPHRKVPAALRPPRTDASVAPSSTARSVAAMLPPARAPEVVLPQAGASSSATSPQSSNKPLAVTRSSQSDRRPAAARSAMAAEGEAPTDLNEVATAKSDPLDLRE
jgi:eukaryotic-like serine/threonine-protein kinase